MKPRQRVSRSGIELIKRFEGFRRSAARLEDGRWTVGYGHVKFAREGVELTEKDAEALLVYDLIEVAGAVNDLTFAPLTQNQFDALVSFAFNIGVDKFKSSSVLRRVNEGELAKAAFSLEVWRRAPFEGEPLVVDALVRRRAAEKGLFLTPDDGFVPAPTPVLPPEVDYAVESRPPVEAPVALIASLEGAAAVVHRAPESSLVVAPAQDAVSAAVDDVAERLRAIVPDDAAAEGAAPFPQAPVSAQEPAEREGPIALGGLTPQPALSPQPPALRPDKRLRQVYDKPLRLVVFSVLGLLLFGFAVYSRLSATARQGGETADQTLSYLAGILGVICIFYAAYLLLDRFAGDDD